MTRIAMLALVSLASAVAAWSPWFAGSDGAMGPQAALCFGLAAAAGITALAMGSSLRRAGAWLALLALGEGATLTLVDAPAKVAYQHLALDLQRPLHQVAVLVLVLQVVGLLVWGRAGWREARVRLRAVVGAPALVLAVVGGGLTSAALLRDPATLAAELVAGSILQLLAMVTAMAAMGEACRSAPGEGEALAQRILGEAVPPGATRIDAWAWTVAAGSCAISAVLAWAAYGRHPHVPDEVTYLLHAQTFAAGRLTLPLPAVPEAFDVDLMMSDGARWYSVFPPGWPALLAIGWRAGVPWLINPLLTGACVLLAYRLLGSLYDRRTARLATLLLAASPWALFMGMSFMSHPASLAFGLLAALAVARARAGGGLLPTFLGGLAIGAVSLIRPLEGMVVAGALGLWSLGARGKRFPWPHTVALALGTVVTTALNLPYNRALTGNARAFPVMAYFDKYYGPGVNDLGFGPNRGVGWGGLDPFPGHGARDVVVNTALNAFQVNIELLGWGTGAVVLLLLALVRRPREIAREDWWQVVVIATVLAAQSLYYFSGGPDFGARYWYLIIVPCVALVARAITRVEQGTAGPASPGLPAPLAAIALTAVALLVFVPWRAVGKYHNYRGMHADIRQVAASPEVRGALVLVRGKRHPDFASAAAYDDFVGAHPGAVVLAWGRNADVRRRVVAAYPGRSVWVVDGPTRTGRGYEVVAGPMSGPAALAWPGFADSLEVPAGATWNR